MPIFPFAWRVFLSREGQGKRALALGNPTSRRTHVFRNGGASQASCCCELCRPDWWSNDRSSIPSTPPLSPSPPLSGCLAPLSGGGRTTRVSKPARFLGHRSQDPGRRARSGEEDPEPYRTDRPARPDGLIGDGPVRSRGSSGSIPCLVRCVLRVEPDPSPTRPLLPVWVGAQENTGGWAWRSTCHRHGSSGMEAGKDHTKRLHVGLPLPWPGEEPGGMREDAEPTARARTSRPATEEASPKRKDLRLVRNAEVHGEADRDARREPGSKDPESNEDDAHASRSSLDRTCFRSRRACRKRSDRVRRNTSAFASTSEHVLRLRRAPPGVVRSWCDALNRTCGFT
eukprot:scaffold2858_cov659-Pavlova_lutheri.AAC.164